MKIQAIWKSMCELSPTAKIATSLIAKDAVGCYLYVSQARSNKKMSPKQRADVANYDLANGIINIGLQLLAVKPIENLMKDVVESKLMTKFFKNLDARLGSSDYKMVRKLLKNKKGLTEGAVALFSTIICQYIIKRGVSPFFSVPVGEKTKQMGIIKPKLYPGETFTGNAGEQVADGNSITKPTFDVVSVADEDTNLINRYKNHNKEA